MKLVAIKFSDPIVVQIPISGVGSSTIDVSTVNAPFDSAIVRAVFITTLPLPDEYWSTLYRVGDGHKVSSAVGVYTLNSVIGNV